jgi:hypothetical protein
VSLVEVIVSMALTVALSGTILSLVTAGQALARTEPERIDLQQRARIARQALASELVDAGAGLERGSLAGPLNRRFPAVAPSADGGVTIWKTTSRDAQGLTAITVAPGATTITLQDSPQCPAGAGACGFAAGSTAIVFTPAGCRAAVRIASVAANAVQLSTAVAGCTLDPGSAIAEGDVRTYRVDAAAQQLVRRDEATGSSAPMLDGVSSLTAVYLADAAGAEPIAGAADVDLIRVKRVRVTLRFTAITPLLRVPDLDLVVDVTPRNLQGS